MNVMLRRNVVTWQDNKAAAFLRELDGDSAAVTCYRPQLAAFAQERFMNRLIEIRSQESLCRERAALDSKRRSFWLAEAEQWERCALDEIALHFRECNLANSDAQAAGWQPTSEIGRYRY